MAVRGGSQKSMYEQQMCCWGQESRWPMMKLFSILHMLAYGKETGESVDSYTLKWNGQIASMTIGKKARRIGWHNVPKVAQGILIFLGSTWGSLQSLLLTRFYLAHRQLGIFSDEKCFPHRHPVQSFYPREEMIIHKRKSLLSLLSAFMCFKQLSTK